VNVFFINNNLMIWRLKLVILWS